MNLKPLPLLNAQSIPPDEPRLRVKSDGSLEIGKPGGQIEFGFRFMGRRFEANTRPTAGGMVLQLSAEIGPVPYSAEGSGLRSSVFAVIDASQTMEGARLVISQHRWIYCIGKAILREGWTQDDAISASVRLALTVKPYLQLLSEILPNRPPWTH
ncbi:MAG TPA: hypothetical protein VHA35_20815 [Dongiaceae bacterium]|nr:hypothetical protein [Dongiaceae bacterium]